MNEIGRTAETVVALTALGSGLVAGVLFAFSGFVMAGLNRAPAPQAIVAMQGINVTAVRPPLMIAAFSTALGCLAVTVIAFRQTGGGTRVLLLAGVVLYLCALLVTGGFNVPLNDSLAAVDPTGPQAAQAWEHYRSRWSVGNHVRTIAALAAAGCLTFALL